VAGGDPGVLVTVRRPWPISTLTTSLKPGLWALPVGINLGNLITVYPNPRATLRRHYSFAHVIQMHGRGQPNAKKDFTCRLRREAFYNRRNL